MDSQDVITYSPSIVKVLKDDEETRDLVRDDSLKHVLSFLRKGPLTIKDFVSIFEKKGDKKSDKTIYRYLHKLIKAKLVAKAGKRITSVKEDILQSETLYMRTAKVFIFPESLKHTEENYEKGFCPVFDSSRILLHNLFDNKILNREKFNEYLFEIDRRRDELLVDLIKNADEETLKKVNDLEWKDMDHFLTYVSWTALTTQMDIKKDLESMLEEES